MKQVSLLTIIMTPIIVIGAVLGYFILGGIMLAVFLFFLLLHVLRIRRIAA